jgi:hypothetical protein
MFDRFAAARLKIERADKHIADLERLVSSLKDSYVSTIERHESIRCQVISYSPPDIPKLSSVMALVIGDVLHNLRVAIEYSYLGAIERHVPSVLDSYTKFPTGETRKNVEDALKNRKIDVLSPKLFDRMVADIKPYVAGGNCFIKMLHDLDISDKHWLLTPLARTGDVRGIVMEDEKGEFVTGDTHPVTGDGPYTVCLPLEYKIKDKGKLIVEVVFDEIDIPLLQGMPVMDDMETFSKTATHVVERLESL